MTFVSGSLEELLEACVIFFFLSAPPCAQCSLLWKKEYPEHLEKIISGMEIFPCAPTDMGSIILYRTKAIPLSIRRKARRKPSFHLTALGRYLL